MGQLIDETKGKIKQAVADLTGDKDLKAEGEADVTKSKIEGAAEHLKDAAKNVKEAIKDAVK